MRGNGEVDTMRGAGVARDAGVAGWDSVLGWVVYGGWLVLAAASIGPAAPSVRMEERKFFRFIYF